MARQAYELYLNGKIYGVGPKDYMTELFKDYVEYCEMYGNEETSFVVRKREKGPKGVFCKGCGTEIMWYDPMHVVLNGAYCDVCYEEEIK